jgi:hypothetical protein
VRRLGVVDFPAGFEAGKEGCAGFAGLAVEV